MNALLCMLAALTSVLVGFAWSRSGLWINLAHLIAGSFIIGVVWGHLFTAVLLRMVRRAS